MPFFSKIVPSPTPRKLVFAHIFHILKTHLTYPCQWVNKSASTLREQENKLLRKRFNSQDIKTKINSCPPTFSVSKTLRYRSYPRRRRMPREIPLEDKGCQGRIPSMACHESWEQQTRKLNPTIEKFMYQCLNTEVKGTFGPLPKYYCRAALIAWTEIKRTKW